MTVDVLFDCRKFDINVKLSVSVNKRPKGFVELVQNIHDQIFNTCS